jgi:hypothetical protein
MHYKVAPITPNLGRFAKVFSHFLFFIKFHDSNYSNRVYCFCNLDLLKQQRVFVAQQILRILCGGIVKSAKRIVCLGIKEIKESYFDDKYNVLYSW